MVCHHLLMAKTGQIHNPFQLDPEVFYRVEEVEGCGVVPSEMKKEEDTRSVSWQ